MLYAFSPLVWTYSGGSEVFALNNLFGALLLFQTTRIVQAATQAKRSRRLVQGALLCGLALCNQHTIVLFELPLITALLLHFRHVRGHWDDNDLIIHMERKTKGGNFLE